MNNKIQKYLSGLSLMTMFLLGASSIGIAQEAGYFNHTYLQPVLLNPGATGFTETHQIMGAYRIGYGDFEGAPRTFTALYHGPFADNVGLGFQLLSDQVGASQLLHGQLNFAYRMKFDNAIISAGLSAGLQNFKIDDEADPLLEHPDPLLEAGIDGYMLFDGSFGIYAEFDEKWILGVSFPNAIKQRIEEISGEINLDELNSFPYAAHFGYRHKVENYNFTVEPSVTVKDLRYSPTLIDLNLKFSFLEEQLIGGVGYTIGDDSKASILLGTRLDNLKFFYSYDVSLGEFQKYNNGSHEMTLVYQFPPKEAETVTE